ncbi:MAG TPA: hypothetical protein VGS41_18625, partial [Chthonomonadales bacterium]|nr:hypothetical protein [Chthonomonadales bacterium]
YVTRRIREGVYRVIEERGIKTQLTIATIAIDEVERVFLQKFTDQLRETDRFENYEQKLTVQEQPIRERRQNLQDALRELTDQIDGIFQTLKSPRLDETQRGDFLEERKRLLRRREAVQQELSIQTPLQTYLKYKDLIAKMGKYWERYPFEDRQALVALLVKRIYLEPLSARFLEMTIVWKEFPADVGLIRRPMASAVHWTPEEDQVIRELYPTAPAQAMLEALPRRSWQAIGTRAYHLPVRRIGKHEIVPHSDVSLEDVQVAERYGIPIEGFEKAGKSLSVTWSRHSTRERQVLYRSSSDKPAANSIPAPPPVLPRRW